MYKGTTHEIRAYCILDCMTLLLPFQMKKLVSQQLATAALDTIPGLKIFVNEKALEMQQVAAAESTTVFSCLHGTCRFLGCS
jgi:hypothetical protein